MKALLGVALCLCSLLCVGSMGSRISKEISDGGKPAGLDAHETNAAVSLIGQIRTNVSSWLWLKADLYFHNGVEMRPLTSDEALSGVQAQLAANDGHEQLDKIGEVTVVPAAKDDFRGWFGDVERATTAWKDMQHHKHNDPQAAIPLFRLMTWLDPSFVPGWTTGATIIRRDPGKAATLKAIRFLQDGLEANPDNLELLVELGYTELRHRGDMQTAIGYFERARAVGYPEWRTLEDEDELDSLLQGYRWLALCYRDLGDRAKMAVVAQEGLKAFRTDPILLRTLAQAAPVSAESDKRALDAKQDAPPMH